LTLDVHREAPFAERAGREREVPEPTRLRQHLAIAQRHLAFAAPRDRENAQSHQAAACIFEQRRVTPLSHDRHVDAARGLGVGQLTLLHLAVDLQL
jgi:hypothetical protein